MKEDSLELLGVKVVGELAAISLSFWTGRSDGSRMMRGDLYAKGRLPFYDYVLESSCLFVSMPYIRRMLSTTIAGGDER